MVVSGTVQYWVIVTTGRHSSNTALGPDWLHPLLVQPSSFSLSVEARPLPVSEAPRCLLVAFQKPNDTEFLVPFKIGLHERQNKLSKILVISEQTDLFLRSLNPPFPLINPDWLHRPTKRGSAANLGLQKLRQR